MIVVENKEDCCGCTACVAICPKKCITMQEDAEGFLYPIVNLTLCIDCGICEKVCPMLKKTQISGIEDVRPYLAQGLDELREENASGGVFGILAQWTIDEGGVVFGAKWTDNYDAVIHHYAETIEELRAFYGSKYLQSSLGNSYLEVKDFLNAGRLVLFSGTPCQVLGLNRFLKKKYNNLLNLDIACHSVPSPKVWRSYFEYIKRKKKLKNISYLSMTKTTNSPVYGLLTKTFYVVETKLNSPPILESMYNTPYGKGFLSGLFSRPACANCPGKDLRSTSDFTLGDFWEAEQQFPHLTVQEGINIVLVKSTKGLQILEGLSSKFKYLFPVSYENSIKNNEGFISNSHINPMRDCFFEKFISMKKNDNITRIIQSFLPPVRKTSIIKLYSKIFLNKLGLLSVLQHLRKTASQKFRSLLKN